MTSTGAPPAPHPLLTHALAKNWWLFLLRGIAALIFGGLAIFWPGMTLLVLVILYGAFALADGGLAIGAAVMGQQAKAARWWLGLVGLSGIAIGILTFFWPGITALVLVFFIAAWAVIIGAMQIIGAIRLRKEIDNEWWLVLSGALSVLFGIAIAVMPEAGALALVWLIALYAILFGVLNIGFAFRLRQHQH